MGKAVEDHPIFFAPQVFPTAAFPEVIAALQAAQARGGGAVATVRLRTVANAWWGIPEGHEARRGERTLCAAPPGG